MSLDTIDLRKPAVQISLDLPTLAEALPMADVAMEAGIDWLEVGTPLILGEGVGAVRELRRGFPTVPIVADLKTMDGGFLEAEMMAEAGATFVVVMAQSHLATVQAVVAAGRRYHIGVMGDILAATDRVLAAKTLEQAGVDVVIAHLGFDERHAHPGSPLDFLADIVHAVPIPVQAVGGLTLEDLPKLPGLGAPLVIDSHTFSPATERGVLRQILADVVRAVKR